MKQSKENNLKKAEKLFDELDIHYAVLNHNLHWQIAVDNSMIDFYPTTHTWYDKDAGRKGRGLEEFVLYIGKAEPDEV